MSSSDFNLQRINTKELSENINATIQFGGNLLAVARRGTGKTTIARETIKRSKLKEVYLNLSLMERPDLGGYPNFFGSKNEKFIQFLMPSIYKELIEGDQPCVAVLDEIDKADSSLLAPLLEFIQFRTVNGCSLKNLHAILMTGNLPEEGGQRPPLPLLDRTEKFLVEINPEHWLDWAATSGKIHPTVTSYIADNLNDLTEEDDNNENYSSRSPRSWENASQLITFGEKYNWSSKLLLHKVSACVGKSTGSKYSAFFEHYQVLLPKVEKIMRGEKIKSFADLEPTKQLVISMILCSRFARLLDYHKEKHSTTKLSDDINCISNNVVNFLKTIDPEMALISVRGQVGVDRVLDFDLTEDKNWDSIFTDLLNKINQ